MNLLIVYKNHFLCFKMACTELFGVITVAFELLDTQSID